MNSRRRHRGVGEHGKVIEVRRKTNLKYGIGLRGRTVSRLLAARRSSRRGVIRDVPPDQTPDPAIAKSTPGPAGELFVEQIERAEVEDSATKTNSTIVEIPQWLARVMRSLEAMAVASPVKTQGAE